MTAIPPRLQPLLAPKSPAQQAARLLTDAGYEGYLVGGSVRDAFLDRAVREGEQPDVDLATNARPDAVERIVRGWADAVWLQGQRFGTVGCRKDDVILEITTFRAEVYRPDSRKPEVTFADSLETDLSRRDFTVNAMAISLPEPQLVDPYGGVDDLLVHRRLRTPLDPEISFLDDPLRMMRAARFMAGLGLQPDPALVAAATELAGRLEVVSAERIRDELSKLLVVDDPSPGLWFLVQAGLADEFLPELPGLALEQDPIHHHKDVLAHTIAVVAKTRPELVVRLAALLHDVGKPKTRSFGPDGVSFHLHDVVGARMAEERLRALRFPKETIEAVTQLVLLHLRFHTYKMGWTHLVRCDCTTRNQAKARALGRRMDDLEARIAELAEREELASIRPALDGHRVMEVLGVGPGRVIGDALSMLLEARIDEGPMSEEEAEQRLLAWAEERGLLPGEKSDAS
jgi:poly(A) polymerase